MWGISIYLLAFVVITLAADKDGSNNPVIIPLTTNNNSSLIGRITAGTPPQELNVKFDVTSGTLWLTSSYICQFNQSYCLTHGTYNHKKSKTFKDLNRSFLLPYGVFVSGGLVTDNIAIDTIKIKDQVFLEASFVDIDTQQLGIDGVLGLFSSTEVHQLRGESPVVTPIVNMINQNPSLKPVFSFYLAKPYCNCISEFAFGGVVDHHFLGDFKFVPMTDDFDYYWITTDRIKLDGFTESIDFDGPYYTLTDPNVRGIMGPSSTMDPLNANISATLNEDDKLYYVDCDKVDKLPTITFVINNYNFPLTGKEYVIKVFDSNKKKKCLSGLYNTDDGNLTILLGTTFMQKYYIQFDLSKNRLGLATAK